MHHCCPSEVEWRPIRFEPIMKIMSSIHLKDCKTLIVPDHLIQDNVDNPDNITQKSITVRVADGISEDEINAAIDESGIPVDSITDNKIIRGYSVFRIKGRKGYWALSAPCMYCYGKIASETDDTATLLRSIIRAYL